MIIRDCGWPAVELGFTTWPGVGSASTVLLPQEWDSGLCSSHRSKVAWWTVFPFYAHPFPLAVAMFPEIWVTTPVLPSTSCFLPWGMAQGMKWLSIFRPSTQVAHVPW